MGHLTGKDIVAIIQAGAKSGVYSLEVGILKIKYGKEPVSEPIHLPLTSSEEISKLEPHSPTLSHELDRELLNVTDPVAYEESVLGVSYNVET